MSSRVLTFNLHSFVLRQYHGRCKDKQELSGTILQEILHLHCLTSLNLRDNSLHGTLPMEIGLLLFLETLDLGSNILEGTLPARLFNELTKLTMLVLSANKLLEGIILSKISNAEILKVLNLSGNNLTGSLLKLLLSNTNRLQ